MLDAYVRSHGSDIKITSRGQGGGRPGLLGHKRCAMGHEAQASSTKLPSYQAMRLLRHEAIVKLVGYWAFLLLVYRFSAI